MKRERILPHHSQTQGTFRKSLYFFHICPWESTVTPEKMTKIIILPTTFSSSVIFPNFLSVLKAHFSLIHMKLRWRTINVKTSAWNKLVSHWYGFDWSRGITFIVKTWRVKGCQFSLVTDVTDSLSLFSGGNFTHTNFFDTKFSLKSHCGCFGLGSAEIIKLRF